MTKKLRQKLEYPENEKSFSDEIKICVTVLRVSIEANKTTFY